MDEWYYKLQVQHLLERDVLLSLSNSGVHLKETVILESVKWFRRDVEFVYNFGVKVH